NRSPVSSPHRCRRWRARGRWRVRGGRAVLPAGRGLRKRAEARLPGPPVAGASIPGQGVSGRVPSSGPTEAAAPAEEPGQADIGGPETPQKGRSGAGAGPPSRRSRSRASSPPPKLTAAMISIDGPNPPAIPAAPLTPAAAGTAATPTSWAARATVLFTPEATPACRSGAEESAVAVS